MGCVKVIVRHLVGLLAFFTWLAGTVIISLCLWTIATSSNFNQLIDGKLLMRAITIAGLGAQTNKMPIKLSSPDRAASISLPRQPVTYFTLGFGGLLFLNGLLGWTGASKKNNILLKLFLILSFLIVLAEIGAILTISIFKANSGQMIDQSWQELNAKSHYLIQEQLTCCGLNGPGDYESSRDIDQSCYHREPLLPTNIDSANNLAVASGDTIESVSLSGRLQSNKILNSSGCRQKIADLFFDNRLLILAFSGSLLLYQIITMLLTSAAISYGRRKRHDSLEELDAGSNHHLHHHGATYMS